MTDWKNLHILVTRPAHQAQGLLTLLSNKGASVLLFPTLVIQPVSDSDKLKAELAQVVDADWVIFISPNAVDHALPLLQNEGWLSRIDGQFSAVGAGTRDALAEYGITNVIYPLMGVGAEALLETLVHEDFTNKQVVIFKGEGTANQTLEEGLAARGATIAAIPCYKRLHTQDDPLPLIKALHHDHIHLIVTTSGEGMQSLINLLPPTEQGKLRQIPIVVVSQRLQDLAQTLGFSTILLAQDASDEAICSAISLWKEQGASHA
jgi:uroporphyrinogen-III synthase